MPEFRLPNISERAMIFGRNGSGKTVFMTWLLSRSSITEIPWIVIDHKQDAYLAGLPRIKQIEMNELPRHPGLYLLKADYRRDPSIDALMSRILEKGNIGVFDDEAASIPQSEPRFVGLKSIFAAGRSKRTPMLFGTQRPSWINKSVLSESDYFAGFYLQNEDDMKRAQKFVGKRFDERLPPYHAHWYDVKQDAYFRVRPVDEAETMQVLDERLKPRQRLI